MDYSSSVFTYLLWLTWTGLVLVGCSGSRNVMTNQKNWNLDQELLSLPANVKKVTIPMITLLTLLSRVCFLQLLSKSRKCVFELHGHTIPWVSHRLLNCNKSSILNPVFRLFFESCVRKVLNKVQAWILKGFSIEIDLRKNTRQTTQSTDSSSRIALVKSWFHVFSPRSCTKVLLKTLSSKKNSSMASMQLVRTVKFCRIHECLFTHFQFDDF